MNDFLKAVAIELTVTRRYHSCYLTVPAESAQLMSKRLTTNADGVFGFTQKMPELDRVSFQVGMTVVFGTFGTALERCGPEARQARSCAIVTHGLCPKMG